MDRRDFLKISGAGMAGLYLTGLLRAAEGSASKPNIVMILLDDIGYECFGCYGCKDYKTPNIDALAAKGVKFDYCYSTPLCTPSRVELMTGRYTHRNYVGFGVMPPNEITFANILKDAGYSTCITGKWQLGDDLEGPKKCGFDEYCLWQINGLGPRYWKSRIVCNGKVLEDIADKYGPDVNSDFALKFMEENKDKPFLVYYHLCLTHNPFCPTPESAKGERSDKNDSPEYFSDMVSYADKLVGNLVKKLDELGIRDNTLVLFTGDNGTGKVITTNTEKGKVQGGKATMTDAGTHVPLVASWPKEIKKPTVCSDIVDFSDFLPTMAEAAGAKIPADRIIDGKSFLPQIKGEKGNPREWTFLHYWESGRKKEKTREAAWNKKWKLYDDGSLYDLEKDPLEKNPVAANSPEAENIRKELLKVFAEVKRK